MADSLNLTQSYQIEMILPELMLEEMSGDGPDPILEAVPVMYEGDSELLRWDQCENGYGLLSARGLGGEPDVVVVPGSRTSMVAPGYYGERAILDEVQLTRMRELGTPNLPMAVNDRVSLITQYQAQKSVDRIRQTTCDFLRTGRFTNVDAAGSTVHTDRIENYSTITIAGQTLPKTGLTLGPSWRTSPATATPLKDMRAIKLELERGTSSRFGKDAKIVCHPNVIVDLFNTKEINDTYKDRYGSSLTTESQLEELIQGAGLPRLVPYDRGYFPTLADATARTNFTLFLADKAMIWLGVRPKGQRLGKFVLTRNMGVSPPEGVPENPYKTKFRPETTWAEGIYMQLRYYSQMPFRYEFDLGFNGGPVVQFGSAAAGVDY
jgi:hypothetical protein